MVSLLEEEQSNGNGKALREHAYRTPKGISHQ